jgi:hypothetical protein
MQAKAQVDARVLLKFGLSESVLARLDELRDRLEAAGRRINIPELKCERTRRVLHG